MKILHVSSLYPPHVVGGAERVVEMLAEAQAAAGHDVSVCYLSQHRERPGRRNGVAVYPMTNSNPLWIDDVASKPGPVRIINKLWTVTNPKSTYDIWRVVRKVKPDVVHSHSMVNLSPMAWAAAKSTGAALVHTLHDYDMVCLRSTLFNNGHNCVSRRPGCFYSSQWKSMYQNMIDVAVGVSRATIDRHLKFGMFNNLDADRLRVVWNGVRVSLRTGREKTLAPGEPFVFGYIGRLVPEKGIGIAIEACRQLPATGWKMRIAGKAPGANPFPEMAKGLPIEFVGFTETNAFMDSIDVLVAPAIWAEPFGLTIVEAFAAGVPVIGARSGAISELVGTLGPGPDWLVEPNDANALAARMMHVMAAGRERLPPTAAFSKVLDAVTPEKMVDGYLSAYEAAIRHANAQSNAKG